MSAMVAKDTHSIDDVDPTCRRGGPCSTSSVTIDGSRAVLGHLPNLRNAHEKDE